MVGHKNGKYLEFLLDDGKTVKYDLSTGQSIGVKGKPVNSVCHKMKGYSINEVIDSIDDENYRNFLRYVDKCHNLNCARNFGTLLNIARECRGQEQYFSSGLTDLYPNTPDFKYCPKGLLNYAVRYKLSITRGTINAYKESPNLFGLAFSLDYLSLDVKDIEHILTFMMTRNDFYVPYMMNRYNYNPKSLFLYIDKIYTYEAVSIETILYYLEDNARMMSSLSSKFEKYPNHFLTTHNIVIRNYNRMKQEFSNEMFQKRVDNSLAFTYKEYQVVVPQCPQDIKDEAVQQNNCVASYIDRVIEGSCSIVFLRNKANPDKSLITVEIRDGKIVQAKAAYNQEPNEEQLKVLDEYQIYLNERKMKNAG